MVNGFVLSYSKSYGQKYISDDKFLTNVATVASVINGCFRIFWGKIFDLMGYQVFIRIMAKHHFLSLLSSA